MKVEVEKVERYTCSICGDSSTSRDIVVVCEEKHFDMINKTKLAKPGRKFWYYLAGGGPYEAVIAYVEGEKLWMKGELGYIKLSEAEFEDPKP